MKLLLILVLFIQSNYVFSQMNSIQFLNNYNPVNLKIIPKEDVKLNDLNHEEEFYTGLMCYKIFKYKNGWVSIDCNERNDYVFSKDSEYLIEYLMGRYPQKRKVYIEFLKTKSGEGRVFVIEDTKIVENLKQTFNAKLVSSTEGPVLYTYYVLSDNSLLEVINSEEPFGRLFESLDKYNQLEKERFELYDHTARDSSAFKKMKRFSIDLELYLDTLVQVLNLERIEFNRRYLEKITVKCYEYSLNYGLHNLTFPLMAYLAKFYLNTFPGNCKLVLQNEKRGWKNYSRPTILFDNGEKIDLITMISIRTINAIYEKEYEPYYSFGFFPWSVVD